MAQACFGMAGLTNCWQAVRVVQRNKWTLGAQEGGKKASLHLQANPSFTKNLQHLILCGDCRVGRACGPIFL